MSESTVLDCDELREAETRPLRIPTKEELSTLMWAFHRASQNLNQVLEALPSERLEALKDEIDFWRWEDRCEEVIAQAMGEIARAVECRPFFRRVQAAWKGATDAQDRRLRVLAYEEDRYVRSAPRPGSRRTLEHFERRLQDILAGPNGR